MARKRTEKPRVPRSRRRRPAAPRPEGVERRVEEEAVPISSGPRAITPEEFHAYVKGRQVCTFKQRFNPFVLKISADFSEDVNGLLDKRLGIAAAVLLCGIEGRQK